VDLLRCLPQILDQQTGSKADAQQDRPAALSIEIGNQIAQLGAKQFLA